jgi:hypothetical protein
MYANAKSQNHEYKSPESLPVFTNKDVKYEVTTPVYYTKPYIAPPRIRLPDYKPKYDVYKARQVWVGVFAKSRK